MRAAVIVVVFSILLATVVDASTPATQRPVRLSLYSDQYVDLHVGNPGKSMRLRLRFDLNQTYLYERPETYSDTYALGPPSSDIFYFGALKLRLYVIYGEEYDRRLDTSDSVEYNGVLAMGGSSQLWTFWHEFTMSRGTLALGAYDPIDVKTIWSSDESVQPSIGPPSAHAISASAVSDSSCPFDLQMQSHSEVAHAIFSTPSYYPLVHGSLVRFDPSRQQLSIPFVVRLDEEYSYLPSFVYAQMEKGDVRHDKPTFWFATESNASVACLASRRSNASFAVKLSLAESFVLTPYLAKQTILRMSEQNLLSTLPRGYASCGRITATRSFVVHMDIVRNRVSLLRAYDSEPLISDSSIMQHLLLSIVSICVWIWWSFATHPMLYQWTREIAFWYATSTMPPSSSAANNNGARSRPIPIQDSVSLVIASTGMRHRRPAQSIGDGINDSLITTGGYVMTIDQHRDSDIDDSKNRMASFEQQQQQSPAVHMSAAPPASRSIATARYRDRFVRMHGYVNMQVVEIVLYFVRVVTFVSIYCAIVVFRSDSYIERLARLAWLPSEAAAVAFYLCLAIVAVTSTLVTADFFRAFPSAAIHLIGATMLLVAWINQLPDANGSVLDLFTSALLCAASLVSLLSWVHSTSFRAGYEIGSSGAGSTTLWLVWVVVLVPLTAALFYFFNMAPLVETEWPHCGFRWAIGLYVIVCGIGVLSVIGSSKMILQSFYEVATQLSRTASDTAATTNEHRR